MKEIPKDIAERIIWNNRVNAADPDPFPRIKEIRAIAKPCEDCGEIIEFRRIDYKLNRKPRPHWKKTCSVCSKIQNPESGKFDMTVRELASFMRGEDPKA